MPPNPAPSFGYATSADLTSWTGEQAPVDADRLLRNAALDINYALRGSLYVVDSSSRMPTDPVVIAALRDACCAQVEWWLVTNDEVGEFDLYHQINAADQGLQVSRAPGRRARLAPRAFEILQLAGLFPVKVIA